MTHKYRPKDIIPLIDASCLKTITDEALIRKTCKEAIQYGYATVFAMNSWLPLVSSLLNGSPIKVGASIGFPLGSNSTIVKVLETRDAIASGADELDMTMNVGAFKSKNYDFVKRDIQAVVEAAEGRIVKVILETYVLTEDEKRVACEIAESAGVDFVKTSSGFVRGGATAGDVRILRASVSESVSVKAAGGIRSFSKAWELLLAGATRFGIGTRSALRITKEALAMG